MPSLSSAVICAALLSFIWTPCSFSSPTSLDARSHHSNQIAGVVNTTNGLVQGQASSLRSNVSEYLGIPYAKPPVGNLRFAAPEAATSWNGTLNATAFRPDCPCNRIPTHQAYIGGPAGEKILIALAQTGDSLGEDCLTLNVWTKPQSGEKRKAVLFWIYGGGFSTGNTANPIYDGTILADENDVVVVSVNYRLNIFGFSGAPNLDTNVGLLDQRLALEWTRDNIAAFGGDPGRITIFGQSAGGASTDLIGYAYKDDPIAHALIPQSGVANGILGSSSSQESTQQNWYKASQNAGCGGAEAGTATVACMRNKTWEEVLEAIEPIGTTGLMSGFSPFPDGKAVPYEITSKGETGDFAPLPYLTGSTTNEAAFFVVVAVAYTNLSAETINALPTALIQPVLDVITLTAFTCPAAAAVMYRLSHNVPVWRYRYYGGNYSNTYINPIGSNYHTAELPIVFGTASNVTGITDSDNEAKAASWIRNAWASFAKNPTASLGELGWAQASDLTGTQARLSYDNETSASYISAIETDSLCPVVQATTGLVSTLQSLISSLAVLSFSGSQLTSEQQAALQKYLDLIKVPHDDPVSFSAFITGLEEVATALMAASRGSLSP